MSARTGIVFLRDFDEGMIRTAGGELIPHEFDGETVQVYAVRIDNVLGPDEYGGYIPIYFQEPEATYQNELLPNIVVSRTALNHAPQRRNPGGREYYTPAATSKTVTSSGGVQGPSALEIKQWADPYDIMYEVHIRARLRTQADLMLRKVGQKFGPYGQVYFIDSVGAERGYYAFQESLDTLDEIVDVADRTLGWTISLRVEGELDFHDPYVAPTSPNLITSVNSRGLV